MTKKRLGAQTVVFENPVYISGSGSVAGAEEGQGPLKNYFDVIAPDALWGEDTFEKAEKKIFKTAVEEALKSANVTEKDVDFLVGGDLLNQIISAGYSARDLGIPFFGIYGACSSMSESLLLGSMMVDGGFGERILCATSSHFATAERQFRYPLELGTPMTPTSQCTATAAGATLLTKEPIGYDCPVITKATAGTVVDLGITDANNMGAAMAPSALETIATHLEDIGQDADYYDAIFTGDLGTFGTSLLLEMGEKVGLKLGGIHQDCGILLFDGMKEKHCGASGCGCSASVLNGYLLSCLKEGKYNRILFVATGALLSTTSVQQGESIPGVAHAIAIERRSMK